MEETTQLHLRGIKKETARLIRIYAAKNRMNGSQAVDALITLAAEHLALQNKPL